MILIAHRGNMAGKNPEWENWPEYVMEAINEGYDAEIDVWRDVDGDLYLGHDYGKYRIDPSFLINEHLWCHAKNIDAFEYMLKNRFIHCFWHQEDYYTLTSRAYLWCYPGHYAPHSRAVYVLPEKNNSDVTNAYAVCSDYIRNYK